MLINTSQATTNVQESLAWGTKIVGGVKPGSEGEHLGLPVFPSVKVVRLYAPVAFLVSMLMRIQAQEKAKADASAIYVPGNRTPQAIEEAIQAEIPLVVAVAEHVPIHDMLRVLPESLPHFFISLGLTCSRFTPCYKLSPGPDWSEPIALESSLPLENAE